MELRVCLSKAMVMGLVEGRDLRLWLVVGDAEEIAAGARPFSFAEAVRRRLTGSCATVSAMSSTMSVGNSVSRESMSSFEFPILVPSPREGKRSE